MNTVPDDVQDVLFFKGSCCLYRCLTHLGVDAREDLLGIEKADVARSGCPPPLQSLLLPIVIKIVLEANNQ